MFLKNCWYVGAFADELSEKPLARTLVGEPIVMFRLQDGSVAALADRCCHRGLPLVHGEVVPEGLRCGYHGLIFNAAGRCVRIPGQDSIPAAACVASYPIVEQDRVVWLWMGDPALADPAEIPRYPWHEAAGWRHKGQLKPMKAPQQLIIDNLLDLTHVGYVHRSTIGGTPDAHSFAEMKTSRTEDSVSVVRWLRNSVPPPTYELAGGLHGRVDRWTEIEWRPGMLTIYAGAKLVGQGAYEGQREDGFKLRSMHAVTPSTEHTALYFWTIAHEDKPDMPELTQRVFNEIDTAFDEDKIIIESQYARLQERPLPPLLDIKTDAPVMQARRIVARRIQQEQDAEQQKAQERAAASHLKIVAAPVGTAA
jgi:phenylpropionate dioxygenase-like ring-hydroxylating dioxygenase large terminal subunit